MHPITTISSRDNSKIKTVCSLKNKKGRTQHRQFIAEGIRVCETLIENGYKPDTVYLTKEQFETVSEPLNNESIIVVSQPVMEKISNSATPSGIVAVFQIPTNPEPKTLTSGLVLSNISDPGNMGTLIRTAAAMDCKSIVVINGCDPWSPKVIQATAGTIAHATIFEWTIDELIEHKQDISLCALVVEDGKKPENINFDNTLLIVGSEAHGITKKLLHRCDQKMTLPMPGKTESLNAAVAGSIALYLMQTKKK